MSRGDDELVRRIGEHLERVHWNGEGCGTYGTSACVMCFGPSPMTSYEVVREVLEQLKIEGYVE